MRVEIVVLAGKKTTGILVVEVLVGFDRIDDLSEGFHAAQDRGRSTNNLRDDATSTVPLAILPD